MRTNARFITSILKAATGKDIVMPWARRSQSTPPTVPRKAERLKRRQSA